MLCPRVFFLESRPSLQEKNAAMEKAAKLSLVCRGCNTLAEKSSGSSIHWMDPLTERELFLLSERALLYYIMKGIMITQKGKLKLKIE